MSAAAVTATLLLQETGEQLDIDEYDHVVFRVHGDGRKYIANLRTENWLVGGRSHDVWQAFLFARSAGIRERGNLPNADFLPLVQVLGAFFSLAA